MIQFNVDITTIGLKPDRIGKVIKASYYMGADATIRFWV